MALRKEDGSLFHTLCVFGYWCAALLAFALPFNASNRQIRQIGTLHISNLTILIFIMSLVAAATLMYRCFDRHARSKPSAGLAWGSRRFTLAVGLLFALVLMSILSSLRAGLLREEPTWLLGIVCGALLSLALPIWLSDNTQKRAETIGVSYVAGAVVAAILGLAEFKLGHSLETVLVPFRSGPTLVGPYLRLSGPFGHANEAAMYFCLALPFAISRLWVSAGRLKVSWLSISLWLAAADILFIALLLTYSRGGLVALAVALVAMAIAARKQGTLMRLLKSPRAVGLTLNAMVLIVLIFTSTASIEAMRLSGRSDTGWYRVAFQSPGLSQMPAGAVSAVRVRVVNRSPVLWRVAHHGDYVVGYHWLYPSWSVARFDNPTVPLTSSVAAGRSRTLGVSLRAPGRPGKYLLVWDLLYRGTTWFAEKTGSFSAVSVRVLAPGGLHHVGGSAPLIPDSYEPSRLPIAQTASRSEIWTVALRMIKAQPILGLGPYGFRTDYYHFLHEDPLRRGPAPSNAHNLLLEVLVDNGIVGTILLLSLTLVLWWPTISGARRGQLEAPTSLAVLGAGGAFAAQGTVEYFLGTLSILFAFWLLCGLARSTLSADD